MSAKWLYIDSGPSSGWSIAADFVPMVISLVGIVMSYRTPRKEHHHITTAILIICGFAGTGIISIARIKNESAHNAEVGGLNDKLQSVAKQNGEILAGLVKGAQGQPAPTPPKPTRTEADRRGNILKLLRNEYILSHNNVPTLIVEGTEALPSDWVNGRLKEMGEKWIVGEEHPISISSIDIPAFSVGKKAAATFHFRNPGHAALARITHFRIFAPNLDDYIERKGLESALWMGLQEYRKKNTAILTIPTGDGGSITIESESELVQAQLDSLKAKKVTFYVLIVFELVDGSLILERCIHSDGDSTTQFSYCIEHNS